MKPTRFINTAVLLLLLGAATPNHAEQQQEKQDKNKKQQNKNNEQHAKKPQDQNKHQQHVKKPQGQNKQQQLRVQKQQDQNRQQHAQQQSQQQANRLSQQERHGQEVEQRAAWQQHRAHSWRSEHRTWQQRGGYNGYRIPDVYYRRNFGRDHRFRIYNLPVVVVGGYPRFQYGGYWFSLVDPWPEYWSNNWYENDYVYVEYFDNGYYLYNRRYPRDRIAISVYVN